MLACHHPPLSQLSVRSYSPRYQVVQLTSPKSSLRWKHQPRAIAQLLIRCAPVHHISHPTSLPSCTHRRKRTTRHRYTRTRVMICQRTSITSPGWDCSPRVRSVCTSSWTDRVLRKFFLSMLNCLITHLLLSQICSHPPLPPLPSRHG